MNKRNIEVTRPEADNSFGRAKFLLGVHVKPDVCDPKKWVVTGWKKTYHERFDSEFEANVWLYKNFESITNDYNHGRA